MSGVLEMMWMVCQSMDEASSRRTMASLARAATSPWKSVETRVLREVGEASLVIKRKERSKGSQDLPQQTKYYGAVVPSAGSRVRL